MDAPCFLYADDTVYGKYFDAPISILLLLYSRIFVLKGCRSGAPCFCTRCYTCKKAYFFAESGVADREPLAFCTRCYVCKNLFFAESGATDREPLAFCTRCYA
jgi:hypothetical protein